MAKGDQIYTIRDVWKTSNVYEHHGIDCGDDTVIHYQKLSEPEIARTSMTTFTAGRQLYTKYYKVCLIPDVVIQRAESRLGEKDYNFFLNNCEHFANWCKTGKHFSWQPMKHSHKLFWVFFDHLRSLRSFPANKL